MQVQISLGICLIEGNTFERFVHVRSIFPEKEQETDESAMEVITYFQERKVFLERSVFLGL